MTNPTIPAMLRALADHHASGSLPTYARDHMGRHPRTLQAWASGSATPSPIVARWITREFEQLPLIGATPDDGTTGQDRDSYSDTQDRDAYTPTED